MWTTINQTYATPHNKHSWAALPSGWRKVKPLTDDGVTNTFILLALAKATNKQAHVTVDSANEITAVYL